MLKIRKAEKGDLESIAAIYGAAREFMKRTGNPLQWGDSYPGEELISADVESGAARIVYDENGTHGVFALFEGEDPSYAYIEGAWLNDDPYVTVHRLASGGTARGVFRCVADYCKGSGRDVRIDTHEDNVVMRRLLAENGFERCGIIYVRGGSPRTAYQWTPRKGGTDE